MTYMYDARGYGSYTKGNNHFVGLTIHVSNIILTQFGSFAMNGRRL